MQSQEIKLIIIWSSVQKNTNNYSPGFCIWQVLLFLDWFRPWSDLDVGSIGKVDIELVQF